jgi:hypothetical protein
MNAVETVHISLVMILEHRLHSNGLLSALGVGGRVRTAALPAILRSRWRTIRLRENEHASFHTQDIVKGADVGINARLGERDPEASHSRRCLRESGTVLRRCLDKAGVHTLGRGLEHAVTGAVGLDGYIGGRINKILRLRARTSRCVL